MAAYSTPMYCKLFASLYQGTLRGRPHEILVFTNLLAHSDKEGYVDKHFRAIAEEVGISQEEVREAIRVLESPDEESRSPEMQGARIVRLDEHRVWGWKIVNYGKYRAIRDEEDRRTQNRLAQERFRKSKTAYGKQSKPPSATVSQNKPQSAHAEVEAEVDTEQSSYLDGFEEFWSSYPSKQAKGKAREAWKKHECFRIQAKIMLTLAKAKVSHGWLKEMGKYIPHPASWLNAEGWESEYQTLEEALPFPEQKQWVEVDDGPSVMDRLREQRELELSQE